VRLSLRAGTGRERGDARYIWQRQIDLRKLVIPSPEVPGGPHYQSGRVLYARCGPLTVRLRGDFINANLDGEMGGIEPFGNIAVLANGRKLYPAAGSLRLAPCDTKIHMWQDCPASWAVRVDLAYRPATDRLAIRAWVDSGDVLGGDVERSERVSSVRALLRGWWERRRRLSRH
jgi:hypothetical protein